MSPLNPENTSGESIGTSDSHACRRRIAACPLAPASAALAGVRAVGRTRFVEVVDLQHQLDRRDAADRVRREQAQPQRHRADQLAVDVHRAAAHAPRHVGARGLAAHLAQDDVLLRSPDVLGEPIISIGTGSGTVP